MDVQDKLSQVIQLVEDARAMPMSASCLVNREEMLGLLDELRALLPEQLEQADVLLSDRDAVVEEGRDAARRLLDQARAEHDRLVEEQAIVVGARERAAVVITEANVESTRLLSDADDYVDRKLAEFEIALDKLTQQVRRGRSRLSERRAADLGRLPSDASYDASHDETRDASPDGGPGASPDGGPGASPDGGPGASRDGSEPAGGHRHVPAHGAVPPGPAPEPDLAPGEGSAGGLGDSAPLG